MAVVNGIMVWIGIVTVAVSSAGNETGRQAFELEEVLSDSLTPRLFEGTWISDCEFVYTSSINGSVMLYNVKYRNGSTLVPRWFMDTHGVADYSISADRNFFLFAYDVVKEFGSRVLAKYKIYRRDTGLTRPLAGEHPLQLARWSPVKNSLIYVMNNNIYYIQEATEQFILNPLKLTNDGDVDVIFNGVPDWIYGEGILQDRSAVWFSPDGFSLVYATFNDSQVSSVFIPRYGTPGSADSRYPSIFSMRYPKVGTPNPTVELKYQDLRMPGSGSRPLPVTPGIFGGDYILGHVSWSSNEEVMAVWTNRTQNEVQIISYNITQRNIQPQNEYYWVQGLGWLDYMVLKHSGKGDKFYTIIPFDQPGDTGKFSQLSLVTRRPGNNQASVTPLTFGQRVVTEIYGVDNAGYIYFQSTEKNKPSSRQVYKLENSAEKCLSCDVPTVDGRPCQFASASFSTDLTNVAVTCSGPDVPRVTLHSTDSFSSSWQVWENNTGLRQTISERQLPQVKDIQLNVSEGFTAHVRLWLPSILDQNGTTKYPLVVAAYGAPDTQLITQQFEIGWGHYLVTNRSYIYAAIDGRGSGFRGDRTRFSIYRRLGNVEVQDQLDVLRQLTTLYDYIDGNRTGIWGWSYGGYTAAMVLAKDKDELFRCGISVAPVTSWIHYASVYTERYMSTLDVNPLGYKAANLTHFVSNFKSNQFLLIHGSADNNVHYQHSMMLAKALQSQGKHFFQQTYPDEDHSLGNRLLHLYETQDDFWLHCFQQESIPPTCNSPRTRQESAEVTVLAFFIIWIYLAY